MILRAKSPNGKSVVVGRVEKDLSLNKVAVLYISENRFFKQAAGLTGAMGIDENLLPKIESTHFIEFLLWDNRRFRIRTQDFILRSWTYPPKDDSEYKAHSGVFKPKKVLELNKIIELAKDLIEEESRQNVINAMM
ncbi:MAG TPA: hypothetical protein ENI13_00045 [candidate division CPR3 bacterium]|uniref:Uncharacterized protein n=1 Tax=candidate division CPR3 bacterium TaxID=2268181 RepID=A0A7C1SNK1_UNCC3|nr:hypothetical protein [candidate division CPR3 bacterium]